MSDLPRFGQRAEVPRKEFCPRHPDSLAVGYCKRCNRPTCSQCAIPTEVGTICTDCAKPRPVRNSDKPVVTYGLIGISVSIYLIGLVWPQIDSYLAFNPLWGALEPWRFLTAAFVHSGFLHIFFNMVMLYFVGVAVERAAGRLRYLSIYLLSALGGSLLVLGWTLIQPESINTWTVGASGALYGLLGAIFVMQKRSGISTTSIVVLLAINLGYSFFAGQVSWQAHIGGLVVGGLVAFMYTELSKPRRGVTKKRQLYIEVGATIGVLAVLCLASFAIYQTPIYSALLA